MRTNRYEYMRPDELLEVQKEKSIAYLPVGPLEWHGPAMPFGTDPLAAEETARRVAEQIGGVVLPTVYAGTERERDAELLEVMGFEDVNQYIIGQDVPKNTVPSFYFREEVFSLIVREYLRILVKQNYQLIVIVNGHGSANQRQVLNRLAVEFSNETASKVIVTMTEVTSEEEKMYEGHATKVETAIQMYLNQNNVDLSKLPPMSVKLTNCDWGINGATAYNMQPNEDKTIEPQCDPRNATAEYGRDCVERIVAALVDQVNSAWGKLAENKNE